MSEQFDLVFEVPSKTFIVGEYLAINGTASMIAATEPAFFIKTIRDKTFGFHESSPAGRLRNKKGHVDVGFSVLDPHEGRGGFGRSTAEYLAVLLFDSYFNEGGGDITQQILNTLADVVPSYQTLAGADYKPSGADLVAQVCGGLCWYDGMNYIAEKLAWPFPGYDIFIFHTGKKLATHEHLKDLKAKNLQGLIPILLAARTSFDQKNLKVFCQSLNYYYDLLDELGLSDQGVRESVLQVRSNPAVLAAKGCGAMGMDTVIVVGETSQAKTIKELCFAQDFQYISCLSEAHPGAIVRRAN